MDNDKEKLLRRINNAINVNAHEDALELIEKELKKIAPKEEYWFYKALATDDYNKKEEYYTKAIKQNGQYLDAYINRGLVRNELQNYEGSIEDYDKAISLDSKCALAFNNRGYTKYKKQDFEGALADYNKALLLSPNFKMALDNKAKLLTEVCMKDDDEFVYKYHLSSGISDINRGHFKEGLIELKEALKFNPTSDIAHFYIAAAYQYLGEDDNAYDAYSKAITCNNKMIDAYYNRGQLILKSDPKLALDDFVKAVSLDPKFIDAYYAIATIQKNLGQYENAVKNLDKIIEIEPMAVNAKALKKLIVNKYLK